MTAGYLETIRVLRHRLQPAALTILRPIVSITLESVSLMGDAGLPFDPEARASDSNSDHDDRPRPAQRHDLGDGFVPEPLPVFGEMTGVLNVGATEPDELRPEQNLARAQLGLLDIAELDLERGFHKCCLHVCSFRSCSNWTPAPAESPRTNSRL